MSRFLPGRASSPYGDGDGDEIVFTTETQTGFQDHGGLLHSTPQQHRTDDARTFPLHDDEHPSYNEGTADMSIEIGRGVKRSARQHDEDLNSTAMLSFGNEHSQHELTDTPPSRPRNSQRKSDGTLRKEASIRRATGSTRVNDAIKRPSTGARRAASESQATGANAKAAPDTAMATVMGSRFTQRVSSSYNIPTRYSSAEGNGLSNGTPRRQAAANATVQSTTHTANQSFMLPDLPNITELVAGARLDATPAARRAASTRPRFVSTTYRGESLTQTHMPVTAIGLPEDEKAIFASLQMLHDRVNELEREKIEARKHLEEHEQEVVELRSRLQAVAGQADSGLGSEEETGHADLPPSHTARLESKMKLVEERLERSERKTTVSNITVTRVAKERDVLLAQLATAYVKNEELDKANEACRDSVADLQGENEGLRTRVKTLEDENALLRRELSSLEQSDASENETASRKVCSTRRRESDYDIAEGIQLNSRNVRDNQAGRREVKSEGPHDPIHESIVRDLASRTWREVQKQKQAVSERSPSRGQAQQTSGSRSRSQCQPRRRLSATEAGTHTFQSRREASAPLERGQTKTWASEKDVTSKSDRTTKLTEQFERDLTILSDLDPADVANLRRKLEQELVAKRSDRVEHTDTREFTARSTTRHSLSRKPSLKDTTSASGHVDLDDHSLDDILKVTKSVRVRSPHSSDEISHPGDQSLDLGPRSSLSNVGRRRRRTASIDGMTSAFIIPDIELHTRTSLPGDTTSRCVEHRARHCTACEHEDTQVDIPLPVPVSEREDVADVTNATVRPSQPPAHALATVIKNLEDEVKHLKLKRDGLNRIYNQHNPALARRKRVSVKASIDTLTSQIERRSDQIYALYDVLEAHKDPSAAAGPRKQPAAEMTQGDVEETLHSLGIDPVELSRRGARKDPAGLDGMDDGLGDDPELPFEGFSELDSDGEEGQHVRV